MEKSYNPGKIDYRNELLEQKIKAERALLKAKKIEREKSHLLKKVYTLNGVVYTTCPEKFIEYNKLNNIKKINIV